MAFIAFEKMSKYASGATGWTDIASDNGYTTSGAGPDVLAGIGRFGDAAMNVDVARILSIPWNTKTADTTVIVGMSFIINNNTTLSDVVLIAGATTSGGAVYHFSVKWSGGYLRVFNSAGTQVATGECQSGAYHTLEVKCLMTNSGTITVRLNGVDICTAVASDFLNTTTTLGFIQFLGGLGTVYLDWLYLLDSTGSELNDFLGDFRVEQVVPDADGVTALWTPSAGSNYQCIDDALGSYDDDSTYISSSTGSQDNLASHAAVSLTNLNSVKFVNLSALTRDDGSNDVALLMVNGVNTVVSSTFTTGTAYGWRNYARATAPDTTAWGSASVINASEFGVRCI